MTEAKLSILEVLELIPASVIDLNKFRGFYLKLCAGSKPEDVDSAFKSLTEKGLLRYNSEKGLYVFMGSTPEEARERESRRKRTIEYMTNAGIDTSEFI